MKKPCWASTVNKSTGAVDILLHDEIGFWGTQSSDFKKLLNDNKGKELNIDINSPGGSVFDGFSIYNSLKSHTGTVNVKVSGIAASIASVIMLAGDTREISENAEVMIHNVSSMAWGTAKELRKTADRIDRLESSIVNTYSSFMADDTEDQIQEMLDSETWFTSSEAVEKGLMESVCNTCEESNKHDLLAYNFVNMPERVKDKFEKNLINGQEKAIHINKQIIPTAQSGQKKETIMDLAELKSKHPGIFNEAKKEGFEDGVKHERDRACAHLVMGESSGAMDVATKAVTDGDAMTATLQAKYMTAGMNKNALDNRNADDDGAGGGDGAGGNDQVDADEEVTNLVEKSLGTVKK